ncbi:uncharacterized transporter YutK-like [Palaemon carinicauda]|uniref:uncharacterized transporter YutK-like n=1 Tax=Palaemon carinicauda TaxID=392227 RepID=UPI0035B67617
MSGHVNPNFQEDDVDGSVMLKSIKPNLEYQTGYEEKPSQSPPECNGFGKGGGKDVEKGQAGDCQKEEEEAEGDDDVDYSICSLFPCYRSLTQNENLKLWLKRIFLGLLAAVYAVYFIYVLRVPTKAEENDYWCEGDGLLIVITFCGVVGLLYFQIIKPYFGSFIYERLIKHISNGCGKIWQFRLVQFLVYIGLLAAVAIFLYFDTKDDPNRLVSLFGVFVLLLFGFVFSTAPRKIRWRHVAWGMGLQFCLGIIILRWEVGKAVFKCAGDRVSRFLAFTDEGSAFVFNDLITKQFVFAFKVLSVILFFSFCIQILYYWGAMQWVVVKLGWFLQVTVGTTACESVNAAANIFLGQTEAPLLIKPYIPLMTKSELHAVMTGGFATIAGSVLAAYISFGVDPTHLLSASVMSAPAALAFSKLFYPETKVSRTGVNDIKISKGEEANWLHAAMVGVTNAIPLVANIAANLIAFYAFISLCSSFMDWTCTLAGAEAGVCSLQNLFGWIFMPLAWVMGVEWSECDKVGQLVGIKTIVNEFVAYSELANMKKNNAISKRAEIIATYALCGFSNISAIGINLGGFGAMAPSRKADLANVVVRAMISGSCACFLTACIAGTLLSVENPIASSGNSTANITFT